MTSQKKKFQKKKDREREVKKKILRRREAVRKARKEEQAKEDALEKEYFERRDDPTLTQERKNEMLENLTGKAVKKLTDEERQQRDALIIERLKKNIAMLEEMEKQYLEEQAARERTNAILEGEGATTMKEKLDLLAEINKQKQEESADKLELVGV